MCRCTSLSIGRNVYQLHNPCVAANIAIMQNTRWMSLHKSRLHCIAVEWREVLSGSIVRSEGEPMLPWRLSSIPCANYLEQCEHFPQIDCIIRSLPWRHCRIPPGIPGSVTPSRALCPPRSPRSQAFRPTRSGHGSHQTQITPWPSALTRLKYSIMPRFHFIGPI